MSLRHLFRMSLATIAMFILSCATTTHTDAPTGQYVAGTGPIDKLQLPAPFATPSARNTSKVIGWPQGRMPKAAPGFEFDLLADLTGADRGPEEEPRFEVNYHLFSTKRYHRVRLKVLLNQEDVHVQSVTGVWRTANWHERETFDLFGVVFDGHPDLRRILLPDDWQGHALRKDFPLRGYEPYSLT